MVKKFSHRHKQWHPSSLDFLQTGVKYFVVYVKKIQAISTPVLTMVIHKLISVDPIEIDIFSMQVLGSR